jgi:hypothetical protein
MAAGQVRAYAPPVMVRRWAGTAPALLVLVVTIRWLLVFGIITLIVTMPERVGQADAFSFAPGQDAHLAGEQLGAWLIPIDRATFDDYLGAVLVGRERTISDALARQGWIGVVEGQAVRVAVVGGNAVEVELLESPNIGSRGWLSIKYLRP